MAVLMQTEVYDCALSMPVGSWEGMRCCASGRTDMYQGSGERLADCHCAIGESASMSRV